MKKLLYIFWALALATTSYAQSLPKFFHFQQTFTDGGSGLLEDGTHTIYFRLIDANDKILYEELQEIASLNGVISALVGNGFKVDDRAPSEGITRNMLTGAQAKYLEVQVDNFPEEKLTIASVPYTVYADQAMSVADGSVAAASIAAGAVSYEHLSGDAKARLFEEFSEQLPSDIATRGDVSGAKQVLRSASGAASIGVQATFVYSGGNNVQSVLKDLDTAMKRRQENLDLEKRDRTADVDAEESARIADVNTEEAARIADVSAEKTARLAADNTLQSNIDAEATARNAADTAEATARQNADTAEATTRAADDTGLRTQITTHTTATTAHGSIGAVVGTTTLAAHTNATSAHGADGVVVGENTLNTAINNHNALTSAHGVRGSLVGSDDDVTWSGTHNFSNGIQLNDVSLKSAGFGGVSNVGTETAINTEVLLTSVYSCRLWYRMGGSATFNIVNCMPDALSVGGGETLVVTIPNPGSGRQWAYGLTVLYSY